MIIESCYDKEKRIFPTGLYNYPEFYARILDGAPIINETRLFS